MAALQLEPSWKARIGDWFAREDMQQLAHFLRQRKAAGATVYPPGRDIFAAFNATPFNAVKLVILGQDPYHGRVPLSRSKAALRQPKVKGTHRCQ